MISMLSLPISGQHLPHPRNHLAAVELDAAHELLVRQWPALYFMSKRAMPSAFAVAAILRATVSGEPT